MEQKETTEAVDPFFALLSQVENFANSFLQPGWRLYQLGIILGLIILARLVRLATRGPVNTWMHSLEGWEKWQLRLLIIINNRSTLIIFVLLSWSVYGVMQQVTWPSRSYVIGLAATVATAWLLVSLATRFIRNRFLRQVVAWSLWVYATLFYLGFANSVQAFLASLAIEFGASRFSALDILKALVLTGILFAAARLVTQATKTTIKRNADISPSMQVLAIKVLQVVLYGAAFFIGLKAVGFDLTGLAVLSGAIGVGLGFGLQKVVSNLVSGIIILLDKSIKPGDVISLGETFGWINVLGARYASVVTRDGREYLIPNEDLITGQVVNWSHSNDFVRLDIFFGAAYQNDPHQVRALAVQAAGSVNRVLKSRPPVCHIVGFGDSSVDYILRFWITDPTGGLTNIRGAVFLALWDIFKENDISIPYPQREIRMLSDEP